MFRHRPLTYPSFSILFHRRGRVYFASYPGVLDTQSAAAGRASPGPGLARVLRALAYCQLRRGLFREALETSEAVLREGDGCNTGGGDAAMLMFRADALVGIVSLDPGSRVGEEKGGDRGRVPNCFSVALHGSLAIITGNVYGTLFRKKSLYCA